jgi:hypothetical protein
VFGFTPTPLFYPGEGYNAALDGRLEEIKLFFACLKSNPSSYRFIHSPFATSTEICKSIHAPVKDKAKGKAIPVTDRRGP